MVEGLGVWTLTLAPGRQGSTQGFRGCGVEGLGV